MYEELLIRMRDLNNLIKEKSMDIDKRGREGLKKDIYNGLADKYMIEDDIDLEKLADEGGLWAVDGSLNRIGSLYPHYISVIDALVISTKKVLSTERALYTRQCKDKCKRRTNFHLSLKCMLKKRWQDLRCASQLRL